MTLSELEFLHTPLLNSWMHLGVVMTLTSGQQYAGTWAVYLNGVLVANKSVANIPLPVYRPVSYIGQSDWTDASVQAIVDTVRVYDYALDQSTINNLAGLFNLSTAALYGDAAVASLVPYPPVYNLDFAANTVPVNNYNWQQYADGDNAAIGRYHSGIVHLNSSASSYIDFSATSGPNSVGVPFPASIGGDGRFPSSPTQQGWSFEVVFKLTNTNNQNWAKMFEIGNGAGLENIAVTWDGNVGNSGRVGLQLYTNNGGSYALADFLIPRTGVWYRQHSSSTHSRPTAPTLQSAVPSMRHCSSHSHFSVVCLVYADVLLRLGGGRTACRLSRPRQLVRLGER